MHNCFSGCCGACHICCLGTCDEALGTVGGVRHQLGHAGAVRSVPAVRPQGAAGFLYPMVSYNWLINSKGQQASHKYLQEVSSYLPKNAIRSGLYGSCQHFICLNAIIDKLAALGGAITLQDVEHYDHEDIQRCVEGYARPDAKLLFARTTALVQLL